MSQDEPNLRLLADLYKALNSQYGLLVSTGDVERLKRELYRTRKAAMDPQLARLRWRETTTAEDGNLFIYKLTINGEAANDKAE